MNVPVMTLKFQFQQVRLKEYDLLCNREKNFCFNSNRCD